MIDPTIIQRIRGECSLLELAQSQAIVFRKQGADWWARCPFHAEKSGSFKVSEAKNSYKCFGCGASGDVIAFYCNTHGLDAKTGFPEALRVLGQRIGIAVEGGDGKPYKPKQKKRTRAEIDAEKELARSMALARRSQQAVAVLIEQNPWDVAQMCEDSPRRYCSPCDEATAFMEIFPPDDVVWCGDVQHSIQKEEVGAARAGWRSEVGTHFRKAADWRKVTSVLSVPGPRICAAHFKVDGDGYQYSRSLTEVVRPRFLVVEHDRVALDAQGALLRWLREKAGLTLRAVVFTGGKSLHGWFDYPHTSQVPKLKVMLSGVQVEKPQPDGRVLREWQGGMGFDAAIWNWVQPWKVPGHPHPKTGVPAGLLWIS